MGVARHPPGQGPRAVTERTCLQCDAASVIFNLPDYHVIDAVDLPLGGRRVIVRADVVADGCPECGVVSKRGPCVVSAGVKDVPHAGRLEVIVVKPRLVCAERGCPRRTFTQTTGELPLRARCTTRLRTALLSAVIDQGQPVAQVAQDHRVAWWTAQRCVNAAALVLPDVDRLHVTQLGIDEHRYRRVRWFRDPDTSAWRRVEPWMTTPRQRGIRSGVGCGRRPRQCRRRVLARPPVAGVARPDPDRGDRPVPPGPVGEPVSDARAATPRPGTRSVAAARSTPPGPTGRCCYAATTPSQPGPAIDSSRYSPPTIPPVNSSPPGAVSGSGSSQACVAATSTSTRKRSLSSRRRSPSAEPG